MNEEKNQTQQEALLKAAEKIQEHLNDFTSVDELWKSCARAGAALGHIMTKVDSGELSDVVDNLNQFICILDLLEPFDDASK